MEGDSINQAVEDVAVISTHALRMEGDHPPVSNCAVRPISTHALRMEGDLMSR